MQVLYGWENLPHQRTTLSCDVFKAHGIGREGVKEWRWISKSIPMGPRLPVPRQTTSPKIKRQNNRQIAHRDSPPRLKVGWLYHLILEMLSYLDPTPCPLPQHQQFVKTRVTICLMSSLMMYIRTQKRRVTMALGPSIVKNFQISTPPSFWGFPLARPNKFGRHI